MSKEMIEVQCDDCGRWGFVAKDELTPVILCEECEARAQATPDPEPVDFSLYEEDWIDDDEIPF